MAKWASVIFYLTTVMCFFSAEGDQKSRKTRVDSRASFFISNIITVWALWEASSPLLVRVSVRLRCILLQFLVAVLSLLADAR